MKIIRNGLKINATNDLDYAQGSVNPTIALEQDNSYSDYIVQMHCGFINRNNEHQSILLDEVTENVFSLPQDVFINASPIAISLGLVKDDIIIKTEQVNFTVKKSPDGNIILPDTATWQELVSDFTQGLLDLYTDEVLEPSVQNVNTTLQNYTRNVLNPSTENIETTAREMDSKLEELKRYNSYVENNILYIANYGGDTNGNN